MLQSVIKEYTHGNIQIKLRYERNGRGKQSADENSAEISQLRILAKSAVIYIPKYAIESFAITLKGSHPDNEGERIVSFVFRYFTSTIMNSVDSTAIVMAQAIAATGWDVNEHDIPRPESTSKATFGNLKFCVMVRSRATASEHGKYRW